VKTYRAQGGKSPVVMVTTEAEKTRVVEAIKAGVNNYVVKPFTPDSLSQRINETLSRAKAA
jgi:two-component system chemotaxis response regulator CheY